MLDERERITNEFRRALKKMLSSVGLSSKNNAVFNTIIWISISCKLSKRLIWKTSSKTSRRHDKLMVYKRDSVPLSINAILYKRCGPTPTLNCINNWQGVHPISTLNILGLKKKEEKKNEKCHAVPPSTIFSRCHQPLISSLPTQLKLKIIFHYVCLETQQAAIIWLCNDLFSSLAFTLSFSYSDDWQFGQCHSHSIMCSLCYGLLTLTPPHFDLLPHSFLPWMTIKVMDISW